MIVDYHMGGWGITRVEPTLLFQTVDIGMTDLLHKMDEKIGKLTKAMGESPGSFKKWLSEVRPRASAVLLQCGDFIHKEPLPFEAVLVMQNWSDLWEQRILSNDSEIALIKPNVYSIEQLARLTFKPYHRNEGRVLRSLLSGELLILWNGDCRHLEATLSGARAIFEKKPEADLAELISRDLSRMGLKDKDLVLEKDFEKIAKKAMELRRVRDDKQSAAIRELKKAFAH